MSECSAAAAAQAEAQDDVVDLSLIMGLVGPLLLFPQIISIGTQLTTRKMIYLVPQNYLESQLYPNRLFSRSDPQEKQLS